MPKPKPRETYVGVDPGAEGAIVLISPRGKVLELNSLTEMTATDIWELLASYKANFSIKACIEKLPPSIYKANKSACSKMFGSFMELRMALIAAEIPFYEVRAVDWQRSLGVTARRKNEATNKWKDRLRARSQELFPGLEVWKEKLGVQRSVCDALLIAEHCRKLWTDK